MSHITFLFRLFGHGASIDGLLRQGVKVFGVSCTTRATPFFDVESHRADDELAHSKKDLQGMIIRLE